MFLPSLNGNQSSLRITLLLFWFFVPCHPHSSKFPREQPKLTCTDWNLRLNVKWFHSKAWYKGWFEKDGAEVVSMHNRVISLGSWETNIFLFDLPAHKKINEQAENKRSYFLCENKGRLNKKASWLIRSTCVYLLQNLPTRPARHTLITCPQRGNIGLSLLFQWISMSTVHRQCWMWKRMFTAISIQKFQLQMKILKSDCKLTPER